MKNIRHFFSSSRRSGDDEIVSFGMEMIGCGFLAGCAAALIALLAAYLLGFIQPR